MGEPILNLEQKTRLISQIKEGSFLEYLKDQYNNLTSKVNSFIKTGFSSSIFLTGPPGCGKSYCVKKVVDDCISKSGMWSVTIDCRIFDTDKAACKEFLRQTNNLVTTPILDVLREKGSGFIIFDHFDSLKIIKRQFFLYTLFDSIHANTISICCILNTSSVEPLSNLEKRVRSRLTPDVVEFPQPTIESSYILLRNTLTFQNPKSKDEDRWNKYIKKYFSASSEKKNKQVARLFAISPTYHTINSFAQKFALIDDRSGVEAQFLSTLSVNRFLGSLSLTELSILFIAAYMTDVRELPEFTFDQLLKEIEEQFRTHAFFNVITSDAALLAWEKLASLEFLVPAGKDMTRFAFTLFAEDLVDFVAVMPSDMARWISTWLDRKN